MTTENFFIQVVLEQEHSKEAAIIRSSNWESDAPSIELLISKDSALFFGKVDRELWKVFADCFEQDPDEFFVQNKKALTCSEETPKYKFSIKDKPDNKKSLVWSKLLEEGSFAKCGEILLSSGTELSIFDFVQNCVGIVTQLKQEVEAEHQKALKAVAESSHLVKEYEKILEGRVAAEEELLAKFHALLNSKKRKIRDLQIEQY